MKLHTRHYEIERIDQKAIKDGYNSAAKYIICQSEVLDFVFKEELSNKGYRFLDRILVFEIEICAANELNIDMIPDVVFSCDREFDDRVYNTAFHAFTTDRRFHLQPAFNQHAANDVIEAYIHYCKENGFTIFKAEHEDELLGFAIVDDIDRSINSFENVLGATMPGIKGKMVAGPLYKYMLMKESKVFKKYVGRVSSSNVASINLHTALGGRVKEIFDEFILDNGG